MGGHMNNIDTAILLIQREIRVAGLLGQGSYLRYLRGALVQLTKYKQLIEAKAKQPMEGGSNE